MSCEAGVELAGLEVAGDVLATVAVADTANALDAEVVAHLSNDLVNNGLCVLGQVVLDPVHDLEALGAVQWHGVALEQIWDDGEVAGGGKLVGEELDVGKCVAEDVAEDEDGIVGLLVGGVGKVGRDCAWLAMVMRRSAVCDSGLTVVDVAKLALGVALVERTLSAALSKTVGSHDCDCDV